MIIARTTALREIESSIPRCRQCGRCCQHGSGFLTPDDISQMSKFLKIDETKLKEDYLEELTIFTTKIHRPKMINKPFGSCIFYDKENNRCNVHQVKPFMCKISTCKPIGSQMIEWFYLNYCVDITNPHSVREWNTRLRTHKTIPGGEIESLVIDENLRKKILSYEV